MIDMKCMFVLIEHSFNLYSVVVSEEIESREETTTVTEVGITQEKT